MDRGTGRWNCSGEFRARYRRGRAGDACARELRALPGASCVHSEHRGLRNPGDAERDPDVVRKIDAAGNGAPGSAAREAASLARGICGAARSLRTVELRSTWQAETPAPQTTSPRRGRLRLRRWILPE